MGSDSNPSRGRWRISNGSGPKFRPVDYFSKIEEQDVEQKSLYKFAVDHLIPM
jgi:hypothetical protein